MGRQPMLRPYGVYFFSMSCILRMRLAWRSSFGNSVESHASTISSAGRADRPLAQHEDVRIVVQPGHPRAVCVATQGGTDPGDFVRRDAHTDAGAADQYTAVELTVRHGFSHLGTDVRVVDGFRFLRAEIHDIRLLIG